MLLEKLRFTGTELHLEEINGKEKSLKLKKMDLI